MPAALRCILLRVAALALLALPAGRVQAVPPPQSPQPTAGALPAALATVQARTVAGATMVPAPTPAPGTTTGPAPTAAPTPTLEQLQARVLTQADLPEGFTIAASAPDPASVGGAVVGAYHLLITPADASAPLGAVDFRLLALPDNATAALTLDRVIESQSAEFQRAEDQPFYGDASALLMREPPAGSSDPAVALVLARSNNAILVLALEAPPGGFRDESLDAMDQLMLQAVRRADGIPDEVADPRQYALTLDDLPEGFALDPVESGVRSTEETASNAEDLALRQRLGQQIAYNARFTRPASAAGTGLRQILQRVVVFRDAQGAQAYIDGRLSKTPADLKPIQVSPDLAEQIHAWESTETANGETLVSRVYLFRNGNLVGGLLGSYPDGGSGEAELTELVDIASAILVPDLLEPEDGGEELPPDQSQEVPPGEEPADEGEE